MYLHVNGLLTKEIADFAAMLISLHFWERVWD